MDAERKNMNATINLPVQSVISILDADDKNVEVDIEKAMAKCKTNSPLHTVNTRVFVDIEKQAANKGQRIFDLTQIKMTHELCDIIRIDRRPIEKTNDIKFFSIRLEFSTGETRSFVLPSYAKFYSSMRGQFFPVEYVRNRDILLDYSGNIVKVDDTKLIEDFKMTDYYSIHLIYRNDDNAREEGFNPVNEYNFYLNGVLTNIAYNNFNISKKD